MRKPGRTLTERRGRLRPLLLATALCWAPPLLAEPTAEDRETARNLMDQADRKYETGAYEDALRLYVGAHEIMKVPTTGIEVAKTQVALGRLVDARNTALAVVRMPRHPDEHPVFGKARDEALQLAQSLAARIPSIQVKVSGVPKDTVVRVTVDGTPIPKAATLLPRKVDPGEHKLVVTAAGYQHVRRTVVAPEGKAVTIPVELEPIEAGRPAAASASAPPPPGVGETEPQPGRAEPTDTEMVGEDTGTERPISMYTYAGFGVGGLGLVVGSVTGLMALSKSSDLEDKCGGTRCTPAEQDDIDSGKSLAMVSNVGFAIALVGAAVGVYGLVWDDAATGGAAGRAKTPGKDRALVVVPTVGLGSVGLTGRF